MLAKNQCYEMTCESFGQDAQGVCRQDGIAVFVPGLLPGERARVRIVKPEKRYAFGRIEELLEKSPNRAEPFCPIYKRCGGCVCQHMTYETSLAFKRRQVQDLLERVGGLSIEVPPVLGMAHPFGYRNKGAYPVAQVKRKHGIIERECYNKAKSESAKMLICPPDKEKAIEDALRFFGMIA